MVKGKVPSNRNAFSARLSSEISGKYNVRSIAMRKGDTVKVMRGIFTDIEGKVTRVDRKKTSIYIEGVTREKSDGSTVFVPIHPSKVMITRVDLDDDWRKDIIERKTANPLVASVKKSKGGVMQITSKNNDDGV